MSPVRSRARTLPVRLTLRLLGQVPISSRPIRHCFYGGGLAAAKRGECSPISYARCLRPRKPPGVATILGFVPAAAPPAFSPTIIIVQKRCAPYINPRVRARSLGNATPARLVGWRAAVARLRNCVALPFPRNGRGRYLFFSRSKVEWVRPPTGVPNPWAPLPNEMVRVDQAPGGLNRACPPIRCGFGPPFSRATRTGPGHYSVPCPIFSSAVSTPARR